MKENFKIVHAQGLYVILELLECPEDKDFWDYVAEFATEEEAKQELEKILRKIDLESSPQSTNLKRISKTELKHLLRNLKEGESLQVTLCPSKCRPNPNSYVDVTMTLDFSKDDLKYKLFDDSYNYVRVSQLETRLSNFMYYSCSTQLGKRVHFYIKETN